VLDLDSFTIFVYDDMLCVYITYLFNLCREKIFV